MPVRKNIGRTPPKKPKRSVNYAAFRDYTVFCESLNKTEKRLFEELLVHEKENFILLDKKERDYIRTIRPDGLAIEELKEFLLLTGKNSFWARREIMKYGKKFWKMSKQDKNKIIKSKTKIQARQK